MTQLVTALDKIHDVKRFNSGNEILDKRLQQTARQHQKNAISQAFVLVDTEAPSQVLGFYALSLRSMTPSEALLIEVAKKLPSNVPGITLARLAVDEREQGKRYGEDLLVNAMFRARNASKGCWRLGIIHGCQRRKSRGLLSKVWIHPTTI